MSDDTFKDTRSVAVEALNSIISNAEDLFIQVVASRKAHPYTISALRFELDNIKKNAKAAIAALDATEEVIP